jgi:parallel beta-helix repeat protein
MKGKIVPAMMLTLLLTGMLTLAFNIQPAKASGTIYIRADGTVDPPTAPISSGDNVTYTFTDDINDPIVVQKNNVIIDGNGKMLRYTEYNSYIGFDLSYRNNVTIKNAYVAGFSYGVYLNFSSGNTLQNNTITNSDEPAVYLCNSSSNTMIGNNITKNRVWGILSEDSSDNTIIGNYVMDNGYLGHLGIELRDSPNNTLRENIFRGNDFGVYGGSILDFIQDVDASNMMDGKPMYYWVNRQNEQVPPTAGYVALINCTNITVKDLSLERYSTVRLFWTKNA